MQARTTLAHLPTTFGPWPEHPLYDSIARWRDAAACQGWPQQADFDRLIGHARACGQPLPPRQRFLRDADPELYYEMHIGSTGEVPTRGDNWHDWFNALCWLSWPRSKLAMNARQVAAINGDEFRRGPRRDAGTLLDESGVIVPYCDAALAQALHDMQWRTLFVEQRAAWGTRIGAHVIGHALLEQGLAMHIGWCGKALLLPVEEGFFRLDGAEQVDTLDKMLAARLAGDDDFAASPRELLPLPLLGIPGWWDANHDAAFYDNTAYFRPTRRAKSATEIASSSPIIG
ncbi:DUF3025 domain-containing protein [Vogesella sp. AC12]|uniref:DUF3025 domain-containing protein n=1 Tax=Vogesella sp. AC12 TaxID=2950550 RepID=UPI00210A0434|nr:DUF3025 domain-containing protein [Vogesella sp. AC12]MCQ4144012.1 DUF3025 domain-containing protein [Vogesella sp. AC12]